MTTGADFQMLVDGFGALGALSVAAVLIRRSVRSATSCLFVSLRVVLIGSSRSCEWVE